MLRQFIHIEIINFAMQRLLFAYRMFNFLEPHSKPIILEKRMIRCIIRPYYKDNRTFFHSFSNLIFPRAIICNHIKMTFYILVRISAFFRFIQEHLVAFRDNAIHDRPNPVLVGVRVTYEHKTHGASSP